MFRKAMTISPVLPDTGAEDFVSLAAGAAILSGAAAVVLGKKKR